MHLFIGIGHINVSLLSAIHKFMQFDLHIAHGAKRAQYPFFVLYEETFVRKTGQRNKRKNSRFVYALCVCNLIHWNCTLVRFNEVILLWATEHLHHIIWVVDTFVFVRNHRCHPPTHMTTAHRFGHLKAKSKNWKRITGKYDCCWPNCCALRSHTATYSSIIMDMHYERQHVPHTEWTTITLLLALGVVSVKHYY